jgi:1-acyl-sn-glycerol-3-phosphate acyltransferase
MRTVIGFLRFVAAVVVSLTFSATAILVLPVNSGGRAFHANSRIWATVLLWICNIKVTAKGLEHLDNSRNYVYVANHASMFDIPAIVKAVPDQIRIIYKKELERIPFFGWGLKWGSYIGVDRGRSPEAIQSLEKAARAIRNGASVLLYAEGTRTEDGKLQPFKRGAFRLAVMSGVAVVPLTVNGSFGILRKHSAIVHPGTIDVVVDAPIPVRAEGGREAEQELMAKVHAVIENHYVEQS